MWSNKLSPFVVVFVLATTSCSSSCDDIFNERPDYNLCSNSSGSDWSDSSNGFKRTLPTKTNGCLVYNGELALNINSANLNGTICNACDSKVELTSATLRNVPIVQSTLRIGDDDYATCLSGGGETTPLDVAPLVQTIETGESIPASGIFLYRSGFTKVTDSSLTRGNEFQVFWPSLGSRDLALEALETKCLGSFELNDSLFVQVVEEPFSDPVRNFLEDKIMRRD